MEKEPIVVYAHPFCPTVNAVEGLLQRIGVNYEYVNIHADHFARMRVREINHGYESVPTLVFPDGTTLTEPSGAMLADKLEAMGYDIPDPAWIIWLRKVFGIFNRGN